MSGRPAAATVLSAREVEVLAHVAEGRSNSEIGHELYLSEDTVKSHLMRIYRKLGAHTRVTVVLAAMRTGYLQVDGLVVAPKTRPAPPPERTVAMTVLRPTHHDAALLVAAWHGQRRPTNPDLAHAHALEVLKRLCGTTGETT